MSEEVHDPKAARDGIEGVAGNAKEPANDVTENAKEVAGDATEGVKGFRAKIAGLFKGGE